MKLEKTNYIDVSFTGEEYAALCIARDAVAQFAEACEGTELLESELGKVIKVSELPRIAEILNTLVRSICFRVE